MERVDHGFPAFFEETSKILILGSFPSVKSREVSFYYGHPQNRFWKVLALCVEDNVPETLEEKKQFLSKHQIALWDVIASCEIQGSSDASIQNVLLTDVSWLIHQTQVDTIVLNGKTAKKYFKKPERFDGRILVMPSTSAANAQYSLERLYEEWKKISE